MRTHSPNDSASERTEQVPVKKYRSVEEMPPVWRDPDDPANLRQVAMMMSFYLSVATRPSPGVRRYRSIEEANEEGRDGIR